MSPFSPALASTSLIRQDCSIISNCQGLNRLGCYDNSLCGPCLPGFAGVDGASNSPCVAKSAAADRTATWVISGDLTQSPRTLSYGSGTIATYNNWLLGYQFNASNITTTPPTTGPTTAVPSVQTTLPPVSTTAPRFTFPVGTTAPPTTMSLLPVPPDWVMARGPASAVSTQVIDFVYASGFQLSVPAITTANVTVGLSSVSTSFLFSCWANIPNGFLLTSSGSLAPIYMGYPIFYEDPRFGPTQLQQPYVAGDTVGIRFSRINTLEYYHNGVLFYESPSAPALPVYVSVAVAPQTIPSGALLPPDAIVFSSIAYMTPCCVVEFVFFLDYDRLFAYNVPTEELAFKAAIVTMLEYPRFFPTPPTVCTDNMTIRAGSVGDFADRVTIVTVIFDTQEAANMVQDALNQPLNLLIVYQGYRFFPVSVAGAQQVSLLQHGDAANKTFWVLFLCAIMLGVVFILFAGYRPKNRKAWIQPKERIKSDSDVVPPNAFENPLFQSPVGTASRSRLEFGEREDMDDIAEGDPYADRRVLFSE